MNQPVPIHQRDAARPKQAHCLICRRGRGCNPAPRGAGQATRPNTPTLDQRPVTEVSCCTANTLTGICGGRSPAHRTEVRGNRENRRHVMNSASIPVATRARVPGGGGGAGVGPLPAAPRLIAGMQSTAPARAVLPARPSAQ